MDDWLKPLLVSETSPVHGLFYYGLLGIGFMGVMYVIGFSSITVLLLRSMTKVQYAECHWQRSYVYCHWLFGEKNLSDLTATIMDDCTDMEHTFHMLFHSYLLL